MLRRASVWVAGGCLSAIAVVAACGGDPDSAVPPNGDGGVDGSRDAVADAAVDSTTRDAALDTNVGVTTPDAQVDANDGATMPDAGPEADVDVHDAGVVETGTDAADAALTTTVIVPGIVSGFEAVALTLDSTNVYYVGGQTTLSVHGVPRIGGTPFLIASSPRTGGGVLHLANGTLYWMPGCGASASSYSCVASAPVSARAAVPDTYGALVQQAIDFAIVGGSAYSAGDGQAMGTLPLVADAGVVLSTEFFHGTQLAVPQWLAMAYDASNGTLDVLDHSLNAILRVSPKTGALVSSVPVAAGTKMMALHGTKMYWLTSDATSSTLSAANLDGSNPTVVAQGPWPTSAYTAVPASFGGGYAYVAIEDGMAPPPSNPRLARLLRIDLATGATYTEYQSTMTMLGAFVADVDGVYLGDDQHDLVKIRN